MQTPQTTVFSSHVYPIQEMENRSMQEDQTASKHTARKRHYAALPAANNTQQACFPSSNIFNDELSRINASSKLQSNSTTLIKRSHSRVKATQEIEGNQKVVRYRKDAASYILPNTPLNDDASLLDTIEVLRNKCNNVAAFLTTKLKHYSGNATAVCMLSTPSRLVSRAS